MKKFDLQPFIDKVKELDIQMEGILVWQDGEELARHFFIPEYRRIQYSVSKSFTSAAVGFAQQEGLLCVQDPVLKYLADKAPAEPCENLKKLTLRDLLTMQSGMDLSKDMDMFQNYTEGDYVTYALSRPFRYAPGTTFAYDNMASYLLAFIVQRVTGQNLVDYLMPRLFGPLGIDRPEWDADPAGNALGMSGLRINLSELFKFIKLYYDYGMLDGKQILPREWIEISTSALSHNAPAYPPRPMITASVTAISSGSVSTAASAQTACMPSSASSCGIRRPSSASMPTNPASSWCWIPCGRRFIRNCKPSRCFAGRYPV